MRTRRGAKHFNQWIDACILSRLTRAFPLETFALTLISVYFSQWREEERGQPELINETAAAESSIRQSPFDGWVRSCGTARPEEWVGACGRAVFAKPACPFWPPMPITGTVTRMGVVLPTLNVVAASVDSGNIFLKTLPSAPSVSFFVFSRQLQPLHLPERALRTLGRITPSS